MEQKTLKTYRCFIAYLDFLGGKSEIENDQEKSLQKVANMYEALFYESNCFHSDLLKQIKIKTFSDNVIIVGEIKETVSYKQQFAEFISFIGVFQFLALFSYSWLVRGGVCAGDIYIDERFVWGKGLIRAYKLENDIAFYPRVIIDKADLKDVYNKETNFVYADIQRDIDGEFFIDFFEIMKKILTPQHKFEEEMRIIYDMISNGYTEKSEKVCEKWNYMKTYYQKYMQAYREE